VPCQKKIENGGNRGKTYEQLVKNGQTWRIYPRKMEFTWKYDKWRNIVDLKIIDL
jgi:hypothetical protein